MNRERGLQLREFLDYLKLEKGLAINTINSYRVDIKEFFSLVELSLETIKKEDIYTYISKIKEEYKHNTVQRKISSVKNFFKFLYMNKTINKDPTNTIKSLKKEKRLPEILTKDEFNRILDTFNSEPKEVRNKLILKLLMATGARISEIVNLDIKDIQENDFKYVKVLGKGSKYRYIPIYDKIADEIKSYIDNERELIKQGRRDFKLFTGASRTTFYLAFREHAKRAKIEKNVHPHMIRHSIASLLLKNGADIRIVQEILGHASITTTELYTHIEKSKLKSIYDNIGIGEENEDKKD